MRRFLIILACLTVTVVVACGGGPTEFERGKLVSGTITASDADVEGWKSQPYVVDVFKGVEYFIRLTSTNGNAMGIWSTDADRYVVEVNSEVPARTAAYTFSESGPQELFLRSPESEVPSAFTFKIWAASS